MEVSATGVIRVLKRIKPKSLEESVALTCAIEAVRELDRIQSESEQSKKEGE